MGVAMMLTNLPEMPQWEELDFLSCLNTLETSIGEVFILEVEHVQDFQFWHVSL